MIQRLEDHRFFNPVQEHLHPQFESCRRDRRTARVAQIVHARCAEGCFDPARSRALIFVTSRRRADALAKNLEALLTDLGIQCGSFHAGMSAEAREARYQEYRDGGLHLLVATKAFGMGIDIPNIHLLVHYEPPAALEDYLQEVGRAGRDRASREAAGFDAAQPIPCFLLYEEDDFRRKRDQLHSQRLTRQDVDSMRQAVIEYAHSLDILSGAMFHLPDDFLRSTNRTLDNDDNAETRQRLLLHWLERLQRITLRYRVPAHLEFVPVPADTVLGEDPRIAVLVNCVRKRSETASSKRVAVDSDYLRRETGCRTIVELFDLIARAQRAGLVRLLREVRFALTHLRRPECSYAAQTGWTNLPTLSAAHVIVETVVRQTDSRGWVVPRTEFRDIAAKAAEQALRPENLCWLEDPKRGEAAFKAVDDLAGRQRAYLRLLQQIPGFAFKTEFKGKTLAYRMRYHQPRSVVRRYKTWLEDLKTISFELLRVIGSHDETTTINVVDLINTLDLDRGALERLERAAMWLKGLGYLQLDQPLVPFAIEARILSEAPLDYLDERGADTVMLKELQETNHLKELRLFALWTLTSLPTKTRETMDAFIERYFGCANAQDVLNVIEDALGSDHELMSVIRDRAIEDEVDQLDPSQKAVYEASEADSLVVFAGPGSGKTRTLLLRVSRLVHNREISVSPDHILVLAYNNAVVTELRKRLRELFNLLGYKSLIGRLRVDTFHSFIRRILRNRLDHVPEAEVTSFLRDKPYLRVASEDVDRNGCIDKRWRNRGEDTYKLPVSLHVAFFNHLIERGERFLDIDQLEYVFVDEFQDVTRERYAALKNIADPGRVRVTVIGDDDQSIYGYERKDQWSDQDENRDYDALPYFKAFKREFQAKPYFLTRNYRSLPAIVEMAKGLIALNHANDKRVKGKDCEPVRQVSVPWPQRDRYAEKRECELANCPDNWITVIEQLIQETRNDSTGPIPDHYREIAVLFRDHGDLYNGYARLRHERWIGDVDLAIHSRLRNFSRTREVMYFRYPWHQKPDEVLPPSFLDKFRERFDALSHDERYQRWSQRNLRMFRALVEQYAIAMSVGATYRELHDYIADMDQSNSMGKILQGLDSDPSGHARARVILMTLHQSKGLEFDAVLIPPITSDLLQEDGLDFGDTLMENRRLVHVGLSRARDRLVWHCGPWERALQTGRKWTNPHRGSVRSFREEEGDVFLSMCANDELAQSAGWPKALSLQQYLERNVAAGDPLRLERRQVDSFESVCLIHDDHPIAQVSKRVSDRLTGVNLRQIPQNLFVGNVLWKEYSKDNEYDQRYVSSEVKTRGWYFYINFYGCL